MSFLSKLISLAKHTFFTKLGHFVIDTIVFISYQHSSLTARIEKRVKTINTWSYVIYLKKKNLFQSLFVSSQLIFEL